MKRKQLLPSMALAILTSVASTAPVTAKISYEQDSQLASGHWVKIAIPENGVYEISYVELAEMGFTDPAKVTLWGDGGKMLPKDFIDANTGERLISDRMSQSPILHRNGKIYFYAQGPDNIDWQYDGTLAAGGRFVNNRTNIYTHNGIYMLSDTSTPIEYSRYPYESSETSYVNDGYAWYKHETDITQGISHSGQDFWGEDFLPETQRTQTFTLDLPGKTDNNGAVINVRFMGLSWLPSNLNIDIDGKRLQTSVIDARPSDGYYYVRENNQQVFEAQQLNADSKITLTWEPISYVDKQQAHLDYILVSYKRSMEFVAGESQFEVTAQIDVTPTIKLPAGDDVVAWDVTDPHAVIELKENDLGRATLNSGNRHLVFFHADMTQKKPEILGIVPNQNLHAEAVAINPEAVIITTDEFRASAERLAEFHRVNDSTSVLVTTITELYNEYSAGRPDPMAYRNFLKNLYEANGSKLHTLFLYGPSRSDVRGLCGDPEQAQKSIIVYQTETGEHISETMSLIDIYGMLSDNIKKYISTQSMDIAVGIMPVSSQAEADRYYEKLTRYYTDPLRAYWLDDISYIADDKDYGSHMIQTEALVFDLSSYSDNAVTPDKIYFGEYGYPNIQKKLYEAFRQGRSMFTYVGHCSPSMMGHAEPILKPADIGNFDNNRLSFMNIASCESSLYEIGVRGLAAHMVLSTNNGAIGTHSTVRTAYSGDNYTYMRNWQKMLTSLVDQNTGQPARIGEIVRRTKNSITGFMGKYKFHLICDPLLRLIIPTMYLDLQQPGEYTPGQAIRLAGRVCAPDKKISSGFNGTLVVKWNRPMHSNPYHSKVVNELPSDNPIITYDNDVAAIQAYEVNDGRFDINLECPTLMNAYNTDTVTLTITAYDNTQRLGGTQHYRVIIKDGTAEIKPDTQAPTINAFYALGYDNAEVPEDFTLVAEASDNEGIRLDAASFENPIILTIDGKDIRKDVSAYISMSEGGKNLILNYPITDMSQGIHSATLTLTDYQGNRTTTEFMFEVNTGMQLPAPQLDQVACRDIASFSEMPTTEGTPRLEITDAYGKIIYTSAYDSQAAQQWNLKDDKGVRVPAGLYKAVLRYKAPAGAGLTTIPVNIPVLSAK